MSAEEKSTVNGRHSPDLSSPSLYPSGGLRSYPALPMNTPRWEHFSHGADIGVRGFGPTVGEAFEQGALALTAAVADLASVAPVERVNVKCDAPDLELLFVSWLNAVIYEMAVRGMLFSKFRVAVSGDSLTGTLAGEKVDPDRHGVAVEAKGATVTTLKVACGHDGEWVAQCIVDV